MSDDDEIQQILDAMPLIFFQKDADGRMIRVNKAAADARGTTVEQLTGAASHDWYPDEAGDYQVQDRMIIESGRPMLGIREPMHSAGGAKHRAHTDKFPHYAPDGTIDGVLVFLRDVTAEEEITEALALSEARLRTILESEPECVKVLAPNGAIVEMNPAGLRMCEAGSLQDLADVTVYDLVLPEYHADFRELDRTVRAGGAGTMEYEIVGLRGGRRWIDTHAVPLTGVENSFLAISRDITDRKHAEEERLHLETQLQHAQRLESIGLLAGGVAHDFNNYLMAMIGSSDLALAALDPDSPAHHHIEAVERTARRAAEVCDQLLTYAGKRPLERRATDMSALAHEAVELVRVMLPAHATLLVESAADLPLVVVDRAQIRQVLVNLVSNAVDALGGEPGEVRIETATTGAAPGPDPETVEVTIADTGCGIPPDLVDQIFQPFFTTKAAGRGLGLATVLGTVRGHGGTVSVESGPGRGTTMVVRLPVAGGVLRADEPDDARIHTGRVPDSTILVVDDEDAVREVIAATLELAGYRVVEASSGADAVSRFAAQRDVVAAVVMDMTMPGLDGQQTYARLQELRPAVPVLFSSGFPEQMVIDRFDSVPQVDFIQKPYGASELLARLGTILDAAESVT